MILFIIILIAACGFTFLAVSSYAEYGVFTSLCLWSVTVIMIVAMILENGCAQGDLVSFQQWHDTLQYQVNNDFYNNLVDNSKKELYDEVISYNRAIATGRVLNKNKWVGVFYSDIYDELEFAELP